MLALGIGIGLVFGAVLGAAAVVGILVRQIDRDPAKYIDIIRKRTTA